MKKDAYRTVLFALPLAAAAIFATGAAAQEGRGQAGGKPTMSGKFDRGDASANRGDRGVKFYGKSQGDQNGKDEGKRRWSGKGDDGGRKWSDNIDSKRHWRQGRRYSWGPGITFYLSDGYYYGDCGWLKRRAHATGSPIWWERYHQCREAT